MVHINFVCKVPFPHGINIEKVWKEGRIFEIYISILFKLINMNTHIVYFKNKYYYCNILQGEETYAVSLSYYFYSISIETGSIETPRESSGLVVMNERRPRGANRLLLRLSEQTGTW